MLNDLGRYLERNNESQNGFARRLASKTGYSVNGAMVCRWVNGTRTPERHYALAIDDLTAGEVAARSWPDPEPRTTRKKKRGSTRAA